MVLTDEQKALILILDGKVKLMVAKDVYNLTIKKNERTALSGVLGTYREVATELERSKKLLTEAEDKINDLETQLEGCADSVGAG